MLEKSHVSKKFGGLGVSRLFVLNCALFSNGYRGFVLFPTLFGLRWLRLFMENMAYWTILTVIRAMIWFGLMSLRWWLAYKDTELNFFTSLQKQVLGWFFNVVLGCFVAWRYPSQNAVPANLCFGTR